MKEKEGKVVSTTGKAMEDNSNVADNKPKVTVNSYLPTIIVVKITEELLNQREELIHQDVSVGDVVIVREVKDEDIELFSMPPQIKGQWVLNDKFQTKPELEEEEDYKIVLTIPKQDAVTTNVDVRVITREENPPQVSSLIGFLEVAKHSIMSSSSQGNVSAREPEVEMVDYTLTQLDIDTMGENNPGLVTGQTIQMPRQQMEMLNSINTKAPQ